MCDTKFSIYLYSVRLESLGFFVVGVFKQVFGMVFFFSQRVTSAVPFCFTVPSVMPQDEPSGVGPEVQEAIK